MPSRTECCQLAEPIRAVVVENCEPQFPRQLRLRVGDVVYVMEKSESGWWGGHREGDDATGWFHASAVKCVAAGPSKAALCEVCGGEARGELLHLRCQVATKDAEIALLKDRIRSLEELRVPRSAADLSMVDHLLKRDLEAAPVAGPLSGLSLSDLEHASWDPAELSALDLELKRDLLARYAEELIDESSGLATLDCSPFAAELEAVCDDCIVSPCAEPRMSACADSPRASRRAPRIFDDCADSPRAEPGMRRASSVSALVSAFEHRIGTSQRPSLSVTCGAPPPRVVSDADAAAGDGSREEHLALMQLGMSPMARFHGKAEDCRKLGTADSADGVVQCRIRQLRSGGC